MFKQQDWRKGVGREARLHARERQLCQALFRFCAVLMKNAKRTDDEVQMLASFKRLARKRFEGLFIARVAVDPLEALAILLCKLCEPCGAAGFSRDCPYLSHVVASEQSRAQCQADTPAGSAYQHVGIAVQFGYQTHEAPWGAWLK